MKILAIHRNLSAPEYGKRKAAFDKIADIVTLTTVETWLEDPAVPPDCIVVHHSQLDDCTDAERYASAHVSETRLVLFGGTATLRPIRAYGYEMPDYIFCGNSYDFFQEWVRRGSFPGWDYLAGQPEREACLRILHSALPAVFGHKTEDCTQEWKRLAEFREAFASNDSVVTALWEEAKAADAATRRADADAQQRFLNLREVLLGSERFGSGIASRLADARRNSAV